MVRPFHVLLAASALVGGVPAPATAQEIAAAPRSALPASMPLRRDGAPGDPVPWSAPLGLLVVGGAGGLWWWWRRVAPRQGASARSRSQQVVRLGTQVLTPQASLHTVAWSGEEFLLACTPQEVRVLARRRAAPAAQEEPE